MIVLEHELLYFSKGPFDPDRRTAADPSVPPCAGRADHVTLVAWSRMVQVCLDGGTATGEERASRRRSSTYAACAPSTCPCHTEIR